MSERKIADRLVSIGEGLYQFDTGYLRAGHTACYFVLSDHRAAIVDCGVTASADDVIDALKTLGINEQAVDWVVPTHVHLDHAGGAGALMQRLPQARLGVHPSGKDHLIDPSALETGVRALYGDVFFEREYAPIIPVPPERIVTLEDSSTITLGGLALSIIYTPGHAWHQLGVIDPRSKTLIAGDAFGAGYPALAQTAQPMLVPVTPPTQFKPEAYRATLHRIVDEGVLQVAPGHFPLIRDVPAAAARLEAMMDEGVEAAWQVDSCQALEQALVERWAKWLANPAQRPLFESLYGMDIWLTAEGVWRWRSKQEAAS